MLEAIHKKTLDKTNSPIQSSYYGYQIWSRFENPYEEEWLCCPVCKKPVTPVKTHTRNYKDKEIDVISHFRNKNNESCITSESDEHKKAKILLANLVENNKIKLKIKNSYINFNELKYKKVPRLPFRWEQKRENRRADVLFEFKEWHNVLGQGIVFEVQNYEMNDNTKIKRETDWIQNGYSLCWIPLDSFMDESLLSNEIEVNCVWSIKYLSSMRRLKTELSTLFYQIKHEMEKYEDRRNKTCRTCLHGSVDREDPTLIACWYGTIWGKTEEAKGYKKFPSKFEGLATCNNWAPMREVIETEEPIQVEV